MEVNHTIFNLIIVQQVLILLGSAVNKQACQDYVNKNFALLLKSVEGRHRDAFIPTIVQNQNPAR